MKNKEVGNIVGIKGTGKQSVDSLINGVILSEILGKPKCETNKMKKNK